MSTMIESIAIFGSVARSAGDSLSDKDVLVVSDDPCRGRDLASSWKADGWSVASFSPNHLRAMASAGSLFIQHLRHEALIQVDRNGWLRSLLADAVPKSSYAADFSTSGALFRPLYDLLDTPDERLLAADVAYVYLRNAGILLNADAGTFVFDFSDITASLTARFRFTSEEVAAIARLRELKSAYRRRLGAVDALKAESWIAICERVAGRSLRGESCPPSGYGALRGIEGSMVRAWGLQALDEGLVPADVSTIWKVVTSPRDYRWQVRHAKDLASGLSRHVDRRLQMQRPDGDSGDARQAI
ncbi:UNVERIFIED_ORG: hypothetical protein GGE55_001677 [Rhizobium esperanzae]